VGDAATFSSRLKPSLFRLPLPCLTKADQDLPDLLMQADQTSDEDNPHARTRLARLAARIDDSARRAELRA